MHSPQRDISTLGGRERVADDDHVPTVGPMKIRAQSSKFSPSILLLPLLLIPSACMAKVGAEDVSVPPDAASTCESQCQSIGLRLGAVAIMANTVGCVCALPHGQQAGLAESSTITAGMATIMMEEERRQRQHPTQPVTAAQ